MRRSCKVTRFLMLWYLSKMSLHLETLLPLRLCGEWYVASNLTQMASTRGLASTCVAGPEFPPTIALKNIYSNSCQHLKDKRDKKWKEKVIFTFSNELATCSVGNITRFTWQVTHGFMPPVPALSPPKNYSNDTKKSRHKFDQKYFPPQSVMYLQIWKKNSLRNLNCLFYMLIFFPLNHLLELENYPLCSPSKTDCSGRHRLRMSCTCFLLHESTALFIITAVTWRVHDFCLLERSRE